MENFIKIESAVSIMTDQRSLTESLLMVAIVIVSSLSGTPSIVSLFRRSGLQFQAIITTLAITTSCLYHLCQVLQAELYLSELQWHRLDNVFAITGVCLYVLHISGNGHCRKAVYSTIMVALLSQEKDPWNIRFTFGPILLYLVTAVLLGVRYWGKAEVRFNFHRLIASMVTLGLAGVFFVRGLQHESDYLRLSHGLWHMLAGVAYYLGMNCTTWQSPPAQDSLEQIPVQPSLTP